MPPDTTDTTTDQTPPAGANGSEPPPDTSTPTDDTSGDNAADDVAALKAALANERKRFEKAERELAELRKSQMSESEKALAEARAEGRKAALGEVTERLLAAEVRAAAAAKMADPGDAVHLLDLDGLADDDGSVDSKAVAARIDALLKDKPYLAKPAAGGGGSGRPPQGARDGGSDAASADEYLRGLVKRGRSG